LTISKKSKKSKHGKKNWRKNINISDIEQNQQILNQEQIKTQKISNLKDTDLFELDDDIQKTNIKPQKFLGKKNQKTKKSFQTRTKTNKTYNRIITIKSRFK
jgi:nucleolar protein 53